MNTDRQNLQPVNRFWFLHSQPEVIGQHRQANESLNQQYSFKADGHKEPGNEKISHAFLVPDRNTLRLLCFTFGLIGMKENTNCTFCGKYENLQYRLTFIAWYFMITRITRIPLIPLCNA